MQRPQVLLAGPFLCLAFLSVAIDTASAAEDSIAVTARFYATPGREAEVEVRLLQVLAFVRKAEPNITYRLQRSQKDPTVFLFYEAYPTAAARETHGKVTIPSFVKEYGPPAEGLFARPPEVETYSPLAN